MSWIGRKLLELQRGYDNTLHTKPGRYAEAMREWAAASGWTYRDTADELVGRWYPPVNGIEDYRFVAEGVSNNCAVIVATHEAYLGGFTGNDETSNLERGSLIAIRLPGRPPAQLLGSPRETERVMQSMGGFVPEPYQLEFRPDGWLLATRGGYHETKRLGQRIDMLTDQIGRAPAGFWQP